MLHTDPGLGGRQVWSDGQYNAEGQESGICYKLPTGHGFEYNLAVRPHRWGL